MTKRRVHLALLLEVLAFIVAVALFVGVVRLFFRAESIWMPGGIFVAWVVAFEVHLSGRTPRYQVDRRRRRILGYSIVALGLGYLSMTVGWAWALAHYSGGTREFLAGALLMFAGAIGVVVWIISTARKLIAWRGAGSEGLNDGSTAAH